MKLIFIVSLLVIFFYKLLIAFLNRYSGEELVSKLMKKLSKKYGEYYSFNDVILKTLDGTTQIDHILISPYGIFVIETKDYSGWIFGSERQKKWTQSLFTREYIFFRSYTSIKYQFQNPIHQNYKHVKAVQNFFGISSKFVFNVVVFVGDSQFMTEMPENVMETQNLIPYVLSHTNRILTDENVKNYSQKLEEYINNINFNADDHIRNIIKNLEHPICPRCGKSMVLRTARKGAKKGFQFWGCSNYPSCRATKELV